MNIEKPAVIDILKDNSPALSATSDVPVIETRPDAQNEGAPPKEKAPEAKAAPDEGKTTAESATAPAPEQAADDEPKKPAKGVQKRLDELTREREEARRIAESERQEKLRLLALLEQRAKPAEVAPPPPPKDEAEPVRPNKADFPDPDAYDAARDQYVDQRAAWLAKREVEARLAAEKKATEQAQIEAGQKAARDAYAARVEKARAKYPDYAEVAESPNVPVSIPMAHAILNTDNGPEIAYFLGKNPAEAERIGALNPAAQLVELGAIVAKLQAPPAAVAIKPTLTQAPKPGRTLQPGTESADKPLEEMSVDEYAEKWRQRPENRRRPGMRGG